MMSKEDAIGTLELWSRIAKQKLDDWIKDFEKEPHRALIWAEDAMRSAAELMVSNKFLAAFGKNPELSVNEIIEYAEKEMINGARWPTKSTNPTSHLMDEHITAAYAQTVAVIGQGAL